MTEAAATLPLPQRARWQPLRLGLVELFRYDSEEFWFHDGHLLLRGNNGTGKSKVLSLTLPLLLDANLRSSRVEPDGDPGKKMAWNLLLGDTYERRTGYSWIEFGRLGDDGQPHFLTLGLGLHAVAARTHQVESWYFIAEGAGRNGLKSGVNSGLSSGLNSGLNSGLRIGQGLWLLSAQRQVPNRERLREMLAGNGQVFEHAQPYRRAVDERLFQLGARRYDALLDTLIQLRQPQLSRKPDERALSAALTESLPPLPQELLGDVADALTQLEELRQTLERTQRLHKAVQTFDERYRIYAGMASRRQARALRQAQTEFDNSSRARTEAQAQLLGTQGEEVAAQERRDRASTMLVGARTRLETLLADPLNTDAHRLQEASEQARQRGRELKAAETDIAAARDQAAREADSLQAADQRSQVAQAALQQARHEVFALADSTGLRAALAAHPFLAGDGAVAVQAQAVGAEVPDAHRFLAGDDAVAAAAPAHEQSRLALLALPTRRRDELRLVRRRLQTLADALARVQPLQQTLTERRDDAEDAAAALAQAEEDAERQAQEHQEAWAQHVDALRELEVDGAALLETLAQWVPQAQGEHPARSALLAAQSAALSRLAEARAAHARQRSDLEAESAALTREARALRAGVESGPPAAAWRGADTRHSGPGASGTPGAPLWQLVDFAPGLPAAERAGLEAALGAAGLLDAWVTPDGAVLQGPQGQPWLDAQWLPRAARPQQALSLQALSLQALSLHLRVADLPNTRVPAAVVAALLNSIASGTSDSPEAEVWVSTEGRFRMAGLAGAAVVGPARHIGHAARQAARERRLAEIDQRQTEISVALKTLIEHAAALQARAARITHECLQTPSEQALRQVHETVAVRARSLSQARQRESEALLRWQQAEQTTQAAHQALAHDATDLRLPQTSDALDQVERDLHRCTDTLHQLAASVQELRAAAPERARQQQRAADAQQHLRQRGEHLAERARLAEQARAHAAALESALGPQVESLKQNLDRARALVNRLEGSEKRQGEVLRLATEARAVAQQRSTSTQQQLEQATAARSSAAERLRLFAATGLLASGLAGSAAAQDIPDPALPWTIDPALSLARRVEHLLATLDDGEERWKRAQQQVTEDLQELQRALSALGEHATATTTDFGFVVHVQWQRRAERPEALAALLQSEVLARQDLLSAREREVLENHLQAEIASQIQSLLRAASQQVLAINGELQRRPTSTGVRFRLQWQALPEGQGAPTGLHAARERLLQTHAELWTASERRAFGALLQQRIQDERQRADSAAGDVAGYGAGHGAGHVAGYGASLIDQLARALDYRQWHQFRVERWQDGQWRKLSGPASSGERALGLTVPLFAAVATFYQGSPLAPRLMLLDEAFAGIDDAARAHCMALVREFDLDFVITSEREWGCYAELPGVAICQLQRREGIDAVHVSRWTWDGKARRHDAAPPRLQPPAHAASEPAPATLGHDAEF